MRARTSRAALARLGRSETARRFARFAAVGVVNTAVGYALYAVFVLAGLPAQAALVMAFSLGVVWNYVATARFVFGRTGFGRLPAYAACYLSVYGLNALSLEALTSAGLTPLQAQALLAPLAAVLTFALVSVALLGRPPRLGRRSG